MGAFCEFKLAELKSDWHSVYSLLENFTGVVKWLSWTCQLQTACQNATQAFPPPGGGWVAAMKTKHVYARLMAGEAAGGPGWVCGADGGQIVHALQTLMQKWSTQKHPGAVGCEWLTTFSPMLPPVNWFDAHGTANKGCEWRKVCHSTSSSPPFSCHSTLFDHR